MKFYFPDSQDLVSPTYDFVHDEYSPLRVRQRDDKYAHEVLDERPYDGMLVSKAIVDGSVKGSGKYSEPQRNRLYRLGVQRFFRLPDGVITLGDCGAFNYVDEDEPPYTVDEVLDFYVGCGFQAGVSIDHVILAYDRDASDVTADPEWKRRQTISLSFGEKFIAASKQYGDSVFQPVGAAQGWSPASYARSVAELQEMGYQRIALGGMVPLKTQDILDCLTEIDAVRSEATELHLLGITRVDAMDQFAQHGVTSFDSTSPFRQSFMDDRKNYHTEQATYVAIRVPQVDGNPALKRAILAGKVSGRDALAAERETLTALRGMDAGTHTADEALKALAEYQDVSQSIKKKNYIDEYARTLGDAPWRTCPCTLCSKHGVEIIIFRGTERNKRRGFHNLSVLERKMRTLQCR